MNTINLTNENRCWSDWAWLLCIFLVLFGARLILLHDYGSSTPFFDDWDMGTFIHKFANGELSFRDWITPAYQHQLLFSKLINVALFDLNNEQWDTLNILVVNSLVWCATALYIINIARREGMSRNNLIIFQFFILIVWLLPVSIEAATWSIVTHFYFMMLLMLIAYAGIGCKSFSGRWKFSLLALMLCAFTVGAGVFAPLPLLVIFGWKYWAMPEQRKDTRNTLVALALVLTVGLASTFLWGLAESTTDHYKVRTVEAFLDTLWKTVFWPLRENLWLGIIVLSPSVLLAIAVLRKKIPFTPLVCFSLSLSAYMFMQSLGIAISRNDAAGINPAIRYHEFLLLTLVANFLALIILQENANSGVPGRAKTLLLMAWTLVVLSASPAQYRIFEVVAAEELERRKMQTHYARQFLIQDDPEVLKGHSYFHIAFPRSWKKLAVWLGDYEKQKTLSVELQVPRSLAIDPNSVFAPNAAIQPVLGIYTPRYLGEMAMGSYNLKYGAQNAQGVYESQVLSTDRPYLMIPVLGFLGHPDLALELVEVASGKVTAIKSQIHNNVEVWRPKYIKSPEGAFRIRASDESKSLWFAFAAPREVGVVSYYVRRLIENRMFVLSLGAILMFLMICGVLSRAMQAPAKET